MAGSEGRRLRRSRFTRRPASVMPMLPRNGDPTLPRTRRSGARHGQGSRRDIGRCARCLRAETDDALEMPISHPLRGRKSRAQAHRITQPAILTVSIAAFRAFREMAPTPRFASRPGTASVSGPVAVGALSFADAVRRRTCARPALMQAAVPEGEGLMAAVLRLAPDVVRKVCKGSAAKAWGTHVVGPRTSTPRSKQSSPEPQTPSGPHAKHFKARGAQKTVLLP